MVNTCECGREIYNNNLECDVCKMRKLYDSKFLQENNIEIMDQQVKSSLKWIMKNINRLLILNSKTPIIIDYWSFVIY